MATVEDVILSKLEWAHLGGSGRHLEDIRALLAVGAGDIDRDYIESWLDALNVRAGWMAVSGS